MERPETAGGQPFLSGNPVISLPEKRFGPALLFYAALLALGGAGTLGCLITAFDIPVNAAALILLGGLFAVLCAALWLLPKRRWIGLLGSLALWGLLVRRLFPALTYGALRIANILLAAYEERLNFGLPTLALPEGVWVEREYSITLFLLFALFPFLWLLGGALIRRGGALAAFCLTGLVLLLSLAFSILPAAWAMGTLLLFWAFLLMAAPSLRRRRSKGERDRVRLSGERFARPVSLLLIPLLALLLWGTYRLYPPETYIRPQAVDDLRDSLTRTSGMPALFRGGTGSGGGSVDLRTLGSRSFTGETVLQTRHAWSDPAVTRLQSPTRLKDYLKSFVGSVYTGDSWERLDPDDAAQAAALFPEGHAQTLPADLSQAVPFSGDIHSAYLLTVRKVDVDPRSVYTPYGLYGSEEMFRDMAFAEDGYVRSDHWLSGPREYTVPGVAMPEQGSWMVNRFYYAYVNRGVGQLAENIRAWNEQASDGETLEPIPLPEELYQDIVDHAAAFDLWTIPEDALEAFVQNASYDDVPANAGADPEELAAAAINRNRARAELLRRTEAYTRFVYDHYTQLPDSTREFARSYLSSHGLSPDLPASERPIVLNRIRRMLAEECVYTLSPPALPAGRGMAEFFLTDSKEGFCVHFATAAVALLRAAGIPCRYAEGYAVPTGKDGDWVDVPDYNAHAWVEVYWSGTGWVPVEVTPAGPDAPAAYANARNPSTKEELSPTPTPTPSPSPSAAPSAEPSAAPDAGPAASATPTPAPDIRAQREAQSRSAFRGFLLALGILAAPFVLIIALRWIRLGIRRALFRQKDRNKAALRVYAHLLRLYRENNALPYGGVEPPEDIEELALRARFSQHALSEEELGRLLDLAKRLEERLNEKLSPWQRRRCKYLLALF